MADDLIIEPTTDLASENDDEKRESTRVSHVIYKIKREEDEDVTSDYGKHEGTNADCVAWSCDTLLTRCHNSMQHSLH